VSRFEESVRYTTKCESGESLEYKPPSSGSKFPAKIRIKVVFPKTKDKSKSKINYQSLPVPFSPSKTIISDSVNDPASTDKEKPPKVFFIAG
jgi:hypothetical protein